MILFSWTRSYFLFLLFFKLKILLFNWSLFLYFDYFIFNIFIYVYNILWTYSPCYPSLYLSNFYQTPPSSHLMTFLFPSLFIFYLSYAGNHNCCVFMILLAMSYPAFYRTPPHVLVLPFFPSSFSWFWLSQRVLVRDENSTILHF